MMWNKNGDINKIKLEDIVKFQTTETIYQFHFNNQNMCLYYIFDGDDGDDLP